MDFEEIIENLNENEIYIEDEVSNKKELIKYIKVKWLGGIAFTKVWHKKIPLTGREGD